MPLPADSVIVRPLFELLVSEMVPTVMLPDVFVVVPVTTSGKFATAPTALGNVPFQPGLVLLAFQLPLPPCQSTAFAVGRPRATAITNGANIVGKRRIKARPNDLVCDNACTRNSLCRSAAMKRSEAP